MLILSERLTTGQITFILRVVIQILGYGGAFLLGLIILGNSPRVAQKETHDTLNRVVGKATATSTTVKWIKKRLIGKNPDSLSSKLLLCSLLLSLLYGLFVSLADIGFIGLQACSVPYPGFNILPANIRAEADARALVTKNLFNGTDPKSIQFHQCSSADDIVISVNVTERICNKWHNSTYDDPSLFRSLNLTDSDVLMYRNLGTTNTSRSTVFDMNTFYLGPSEKVVLEPTISDGIAVLPYETGVQMVVGAPSLTRNQTVTIPKTMAVEVDVGCLFLGMVGTNIASDVARNSYDWYMPDATYKPIQRSKYAGPDHLYGPLRSTADAIRAFVSPTFNTSLDGGPEGYIRRNNRSTYQFGWQTEISSWYPIYANGSSAVSEAVSILKDCSEQVDKAFNASIPSDTVKGTSPSACGFYHVRGSMSLEGVAIQVYSVMACASATAVNMVSATLETDSDGRLSGRLSRLPSKLNIVRANYFDVIHNIATDTTVYAEWGQIQRYTLSDAPLGDVRHYIYQQYPVGSTALGLSLGSESPGYAFAQVGAEMVTASVLESMDSILLVNASLFSWNQLNASTVTKWASGFGASYFLTSIGFNGFAALDQQPFTIHSTGGRLRCATRSLMRSLSSLYRYQLSSL